MIFPLEIMSVVVQHKLLIYQRDPEGTWKNGAKQQDDPAL